MKYNLPEQLHKIKTKNLSVEDKNLIWSGIIFNKPNKVKGILLPFNLNIRENNAKVIHHRALVALKKLLPEYEI